MTTKYNLPAPVRIGVLKSTPAVYKTPAGEKTSNAYGYYAPHEVVTPAIHNQWTDTGTIGLLISFHVESSEDGSTVVGLVELPSGQFETYSASCLKLVTPSLSEPGYAQQHICKSNP